MDAITISVLTVSDGVVAGARDDVGGRTIAEWAADGHRRLRAHVAVADDTAEIVAALLAAAVDGVDVVITTGGTGLTERDVTPEATLAVIERNVPGIAECIRARGAAHTNMSWISRGVAGVRGRTLIVNLPGSSCGVRDGLAVLGDILPHAVQLLRGIDTQTHPAPHG